MTRYHVQYWSQFYEEWRDYVAPAFSGRKAVFQFPSDADATEKRLACLHPRDKFRVVCVEAV